MGEKMNVLFLSISSLPHISEHSISLDLIHEFQRNGHTVFIVCAIEKRDDGETNLSEEAGCFVLRVKIGNNKKAGIIEKGMTTLSLPYNYISAIKKYYGGIKFDLVLYPTPPITQVKTVKFIKKRDHAASYLLLKDIFPQNAVDIGMLSKGGIKGIIYNYFRHQEKELYSISDFIGCMSQANVDYILANNPEVSPAKVEICPNSIEYVDMTLSEPDRLKMRAKYDLPFDKKVFVYGGNLGKPQGIPFLIECLRAEKNNQDVFFLIVGDGTEYPKIESFVNNEKPQNVKLMKRLPKEDYDRLVAACDVGMVFLDHRFTIPNFPSRLLSYMQAGIPVLACTDKNTDVGTTIEKGGFGWWCESNNPLYFVNKIEEIIFTDSVDIQKMSKFEKQFLLDVFAVNNVYTQILEHYI